jgi:plasmid stabilization system protein ParE
VSRAVILTPAAERDVSEAYWWYEEQDAGLGEEFLRCLEAAISRISTSPLIYPVRFDDFRRILIRRFPYAVYFEHDDTTVTVFGVFHGAQDPAKVAARLKG